MPSRVIGATIVCWGAVFVLWYTIVLAGGMLPVLLPYPHTIITSAYELIVYGYPHGITLLEHIVSSFWLILRGFGLGAFLAIVLSLPLGWFPFLRALTQPIITVGRAIPAVSWLPIVVILFGVGDVSKLFIIVYGCFWVALTNSIAAVQSVDPTLIRVARNYKASTRQILGTVVLPAALPGMLIGVRVAYGLAYMVLIVAEMLGASRGIGFLIHDARGVYRTDLVFVGMITIGLLGFVTAYFLELLERRLVRWRYV